MTTPVELMLLLRLLLILLILLLAEDEGLGKDSTLQCAPERGGSTETTRVFRLFLLVQLSLSASGSEIKPLRPGPARCPIAGPGREGHRTRRESGPRHRHGKKKLGADLPVRSQARKPEAKASNAGCACARGAIGLLGALCVPPMMSLRRVPGSGMLLGRNPGP